MKLIILMMMLSQGVHSSTEQNGNWLSDFKQKAEAMIGAFAPLIVGVSVWDFDTAGLGGDTGALDQFGSALTHGDYNGDGWQDLAIGVPYFDYIFGAHVDSGVVLVLYGSENGLDNNDHQYLYQSLVADTDGIEAGDLFGFSMTSGDFNGDGYTDLVVGSPYEDVDILVPVPPFLIEFTRNQAGAVNIFYGSSTGFADLGAGSTYLHQGTGLANPDGPVKAGDQFGRSLAAGDFDNDGFDDLVVGVPFENFGNANQILDGGQVDIYYGSSNGITAADSETLAQGSLGLEGLRETQDRFGNSVATGYFDDDAYVDLVIGIPGQDVNGEEKAGAVHVVYGNIGGLSANDEVWSQADDISGAVESGDNFGYSVTTGDFDGNGLDDLAVGVYREDLNADGIVNAGAVNVIYAEDNGNGLSSAGNQIFHQEIDGIDGNADDNDRFGETLTTADFNHDGYADLVVGYPNDWRIGAPVGATSVMVGSETGLTTNNLFLFTNIPDDKYGAAITAGDFGQGVELVIGIPGANSADGDDDSGSVMVIQFLDLIFKDTFETL